MRLYEIDKPIEQVIQETLAASKSLIEDARVTTLPEYSYVKLIKPFGNLPTGAEGTIVNVYLKTHTYMIEFFAPVRAIETVDMSMVEPSGNA